MSAQRATGHGKIVDELTRLADVRNAWVTLLFASGATIEGGIDDVDPDGQWVIFVERVTVEMPPSDQRTMLTRHVIDVAALVAVGQVDP